jgi:protein-L-isoaspartate(D-aspartate) O-methyltransferase
MNANADTIVTEPLQFEAQRLEMVAAQLRGRGIRSESVLAAMSRIPRHEFISAGQAAAAYTDHALPIADGQTISQPYVVAAMTEALALSGAERVLDIGSGSGYQAAVLSTLAREVIAVEWVSHLADSSRERLGRLGFTNIRLEQGDGSLGWPVAAPYGAILVAAAAPEIPPPLLDQLAEGGRLVIPVGTLEEQNLICVTKRAGQLTTKILFACRFIPLLGRYGWPGGQQGHSAA